MSIFCTDNFREKVEFWAKPADNNPEGDKYGYFKDAFAQETCGVFQHGILHKEEPSYL
jgi:hypothetical protein